MTPEAPGLALPWARGPDAWETGSVLSSGSTVESWAWTQYMPPEVQVSQDAELAQAWVTGSSCRAGTLWQEVLHCL